MLLVVAAVRAAPQVASRPLHDAGAVLLRTACRALVDPHLAPTPSTMAPLGPNGALLLEWVDRTGGRVERLRCGGARMG